jgi:NAD(P)-dependent dehydrogenase (short-subunit alcohol dehydrogenase family)
MKSIVIGAGGGIGSALVAALRGRGEVVVGLARNSLPRLDLGDEASIAAAAEALAGDAPFDRLIVASGLLHDAEVQPEKAIAAVSQAGFDRYFAVNATGPALAIRHFLRLMPRDRRAAIAVLSARVGSIGDNRLGGWVGYRASKAALNQIVRTFAIELGRTHPQLVLAALHPGTVATRLSAPFRRSLPPGQLATPEQSAERLLAVLDALTPADSGGCFDANGLAIAP